jgi:hypothetical protein
VSDAKPAGYIANFGSEAAMLRALGNYLRGEDFPMTGVMSPSIEPLMKPLVAAVNALPKRVREEVYTWSGRSEAVPPKKLDQVRAEEVSSWVASYYPRRRYPAAMIGSSNGALVHLCAALGIPWLPQTFLITVRRNMDPDEPARELEWGRGAARELLATNPELELHHMFDPNQDRLMARHIAYFRVKRLQLGDTYERFLEENLSEGATLFVAECGLKWPTTRVEKRHVFQFGALGGATPEEFLRGSERVEAYLARYGSRRRRWEPPEPDGERPEAEWGFESTLREDVERFASERGYRIRRIIFEQPEDPSPLVADLYRRWYEGRGLPANRLLVESFILMEPWWALRTGSVPFWMVFNTEPDAEALERYLEGTKAYDHIHLMLFSHGVDSVGLALIGRWRSMLQLARKHGSFMGVDERRFPRDFAAFVRYHIDLKEISARHPMPRSLQLTRLDEFLGRTGDRYPVRLT